MSAAHKVLSGERLPIPENCPEVLALVMQMCWKDDPNDRPDFEQILDVLKTGRNDNEIDPDMIQMQTMATNYVENRMSKMSQAEQPYNNLNMKESKDYQYPFFFSAKYFFPLQNFRPPPAKSFYDHSTSVQPSPAMYEEVEKKE